MLNFSSRLSNNLTFWLLITVPKTIVDQGICRIAIPIFAAFAVHVPLRYSTSVVELVVDGLVANVGIGIVP